MDGGDGAGVTAGQLVTAGGALGLGVAEVVQGEVDEGAFVLHASGVAAEMDCFDQGGADPAHGIHHQVPQDE